MFRGYGAIVVLAALFFIAAKIGDTFAKTLTIFSIFIWTIAAALFAYLILFRGMKLSFFGFGKPDIFVAQDDLPESDEFASDSQSEPGDRTPPSANS